MAPWFASGRADWATIRCRPPSADPFIHQELTELMYHALWETVHVFFEQKSLGDDVGASAFLYPFLGGGDQIARRHAGRRGRARSVQKAAEDDRAAQRICRQRRPKRWPRAVLAMHERIAAGGTLLAFGNGGSATDANDLVLGLRRSARRHAADSGHFAVDGTGQHQRDRQRRRASSWCSCGN